MKKMCEVCGSEFEPSKYVPYQKYCSRRCKHRRYDRDIRYRRSEEFHSLRLDVVEKLGGICLACGETDKFVLSIDHIHNDGWKEKTTRVLLKRILRDIEIAKEKYQILCLNHNFMKSVYPDEFHRRFPQVPSG